MVALLIAMLVIGVARALEPPKKPEWMLRNPCFDDTGKWYRR